MPYTHGIWRPHDWRDYEIELIGGDLNTIGLLDEAYNPKFTWGLYGYGDGSFSLHLDSEYAADLLSDEMFYSRILRDGVQICDFMLAKKDEGYAVTRQYTDDYIQIALAPLDAILKDKVCLPATPGEDSKFAPPSDNIDNAFKWIVDHVCGPNAYPGPGGSSRVLPGLTIAADTASCPTVYAITEAHKMDLYEFLQKYGPTWDVDWRVRMERTTGIANQMVFETFYPRRGLDKTVTNTDGNVPVILNDASGEIRQARRYRPGLGFANVIIAKDGSSEVKDSDSILAYGRREYLATTDGAQQNAAILADRSQREGEEIEFVESEMLELGSGALDLQPGDEITTGNHKLGIATHDQLVQEAAIELGSDGAEKISLTLGRYEKTLLDKVKEAAGGGSGGGAGGLTPNYDPIEGLKDNAGTFVPFSAGDDYIWVQLKAGAGVSIVGTVATNLITIGLSLAESNLPTHDIITKHSYTGGAALDVFGLSAANTIAKLTPSSNPGAASAILKSDASGNISLKEVTGTGFLLAATCKITGAANMQIQSAGYLSFLVSGGTESWRISTSHVLRAVQGGDIGLSTERVGTVYTGAANLSLDLTFATGKGVVHPDASTGQTLRHNGTRFIPAKLAITDMSATHTHTVSITSGDNSNFVNRGISEEDGYDNQTWIWCNDNNTDAVTGGYWAKCAMSDGTHHHEVTGNTGAT